MYFVEVGEQYAKWANHAEEVQFDIADDGASLLVFFRTPSKEEVEQFQSDKPFEIRFTELAAGIIMTVKIGNLDWMDAPYTPHLSLHLTKIPCFQADEGLSLTVYLIDAVSGRLMNMRLIGLSHEFSQRLSASAAKIMQQSFDEITYRKAVIETFRKYSTKQIVDFSNAYCRIRH